MVKNTQARWYHILTRTSVGASLPFVVAVTCWSLAGSNDGAFFVGILFLPILALCSLLGMLACNLSPLFRRISYAACAICLALLGGVGLRWL